MAPVEVWRIELREADAWTAARTILAARAGVDAADLVVSRGSRGKPFLGGLPDAPELSLSHSGDVAVLAVSSEGAVGVDVEAVREVARAVAVARRAFGEREAARLAALAPEHRSRAFLRSWTAKEAVLKATGEGLGGRGDGDWAVTRIDVGPGYVAALAAAAPLPEIRLRRYEPGRAAPAARR